MTQAFPTSFRGSRLLLVAIVIFASGHAAAAPLPTTQLLPVVSGDEETRSTPFIAWFKDLSVHGYIEEEFVVSGAANIYSYVNDANQPDVEVLKADVPYVTRMLVRRPEDPAKLDLLATGRLWPESSTHAMGCGDEVHTIFKLLTHYDFRLG